ncbi:related to N-acetylglucosaminyl-phosphatidylinositol biosynthetic protein gpi1 [Cephalotrichum gorgonifer]|uniref:Related to N-acetylglucosaminyl-phosphatidylinositol biosynthetic protein gpi1 n=1 Tax=Cephalotrichum gorgonifer TaxID=2041049 RepID=A0AAE8SXX1_9PEZI|nr:related to N-acetylglucosaminyl-phosphatidylinositol biosynthetic protein gpi1 [Cephalotrichum gorgonifer]
MHAFSILAWAIFVAGYITARWDLVTRLRELGIFAWEYGVVARAAKAFGCLTLVYVLILVPVERLTSTEANTCGANNRPDYPPESSYDAEAPSNLTDTHDFNDDRRADIARSTFPGVIVGWKNSELDFFVVAVLEVADARNVEHHVRVGTLVRNARHSIDRMYDLCGHDSLHVLGVTNALDTETLDPSWVRATTTPAQAIPIIRYDRASNIQIILFKRPRPIQMQYMSLNPIALALEDRYFDAPTRSLDAEYERQERERREVKLRLVEKLRQHIIVNRVLSPKEKTLPLVVNQINWAWEVEQLLQSNLHLVGKRPKRSLSVSERVVESANTVKNAAVSYSWRLFKQYVLPLIQRAFILVLIGHRVAAEVLLAVLEFRARPHHAALKDISAIAQQVEIRLLQFCYWPIQNATLRQRKNDWASVTTGHPDYIRFFNSLWLVANDVIIGIALGSYIIEHCEWVGDQLGLLLRTYTVVALRNSITWLMGWPAGLKLNNELGTFLGDLFLWVIDYWSGFINTIQPMLPKIIWFIGFSSFGGASMPIAMFSDLLSALTIHIYSFYLASARIFNWQLSILISLFHLFRGKKHNVLRNRIDSCDYDLDQLLVGTIVFTLLVYLLPTVLVFYINFAFARMIIIMLKAVFDTLLSCLNHFPLFALMLRIKDPARLPGGLRFELGRSISSASSSDAPPTSIIRLKASIPNPRPRLSHSNDRSLTVFQPTPLSFGGMFHQYLNMAHRIRKHYLSPTVLVCLLTGKLVPPIDMKNLYSLQYSMLPAKRPGILEMWSALSSSAPPKKPGWMAGGSKRGGQGRRGHLR